MLIQSPDSLPLPTLHALSGEAIGYLKDALQQALQISVALLSSIRELKTEYTKTTLNLRAAPDGTYIISHAKKNRSPSSHQFAN